LTLSPPSSATEGETDEERGHVALELADHFAEIKKNGVAEATTAEANRASVKWSAKGANIAKNLGNKDEG